MGKSVPKPHTKQVSCKDRHAPPDPRIQVQEVSFDWGRPFEEALGPLNYGCEGVGDML